VGCSEHGDKPLGSGTIELISYHTQVTEVCSVSDISD
jgi:hypothetical protein